jgi:hypothetical protein
MINSKRTSQYGGIFSLEADNTKYFSIHSQLSVYFLAFKCF